MGGRMHLLIIPAPAPRRLKPAQVIPISTAVSQAGETTVAEARWHLHSAPTGGMNVLTTDSGRRNHMRTFTIDSENQVTAWGSGAEAEQNASSGAARFGSIEELG
jgi:uncharacterized protein DUF3489